VAAKVTAAAMVLDAWLTCMIAPQKLPRSGTCGGGVYTDSE
jgi:hypothetical protein